MKMVCGERFLVLMLGNTVEERLVNSFTNAGTSGWSALISWRHHRELRWTQLYGLPVSPCMMIMKIMKTFITKSYFSLEQSLTHTHTHTHKNHSSTRSQIQTYGSPCPARLQRRRNSDLCLWWNQQPCLCLSPRSWWSSPAMGRASPRGFGEGKSCVKARREGF